MRFLISLSFLVLVSCGIDNDKKDSIIGVKQAEVSTTDNSKSSPFSNTVNKLDAYWHQGLGEINVYQLQQNRYKDIYDGQVVLVFVTEDFLTDKQVKNDQYKDPKSTPILKTNMIQRFTTGIYDYSMMTSVFTPIKTSDWPSTIKVTNTGQDWCGQVFSQINWDKKGTYKHTLFSYFETEGDQENISSAAILEDELLNRIRMGWEHLPQGEHQIIPSMNFLRLKHQTYTPHTATLNTSDYNGDEITSDHPLKVYTINYPDLNRKLEIVFQASPPYLIEGWKDSYPSIFDKQTRSTLAIRQKTMLDNYWSHHQPEDSKMRTDLGLSK